MTAPSRRRRRSCRRAAGRSCPASAGLRRPGPIPSDRSRSTRACPPPRRRGAAGARPTGRGRWASAAPAPAGRSRSAASAAPDAASAAARSAPTCVPTRFCSTCWSLASTCVSDSLQRLHELFDRLLAAVEVGPRRLLEFRRATRARARGRTRCSGAGVRGQRPRTPRAAWLRRPGASCELARPRLARSASSSAPRGAALSCWASASALLERVQLSRSSWLRGATRHAGPRDAPVGTRAGAEPPPVPVGRGFQARTRPPPATSDGSHQQKDQWSATRTKFRRKSRCARNLESSRYPMR